MTDQVNEALETLTQYSAEHGHPADFEAAISTLSALAHPSRGVVDEAHPVIRDLRETMKHCVSAADEGVDYAVSRQKLDALTTLGLMEKAGRGRWAPTKAGEAFAALQAAALPAVPEVPDNAARIMGRMLETNCVTMQAAWIEWQHGKGAEAAMSWIHNTLWGPGLIPDENEPYAKEAQAWFDANRPDAFPACPCGRPSNILWMGKGFCCNAHYQDAKAATPAHDQPEGAR